MRRRLLVIGKNNTKGDAEEEGRRMKKQRAL